MKKFPFPSKKTLILLSPLVLLILVLFIQSCEKAPDEPTAAAANQAASKKGNPHNPPPPPPDPFYFSCGSPVISESFKAGVPTNATVTLNYFNSPGGSYPAFTSATVNGITLSAPAGTLNTGSGSFVFTASGTPVNSGVINISVSVASSALCPLVITISNAPVSGPTADPGATAGSTGIINFTYRGQAVAYKTVRADDGKIWLQQNLGSPQVAFHEGDVASYGDYFQWGRWDDGHQLANSAAVTGGAGLQNPSNIPSGYPNFIKGSTAGTRWWGIGGLASDTWSGTQVSSTNGKDPCAALGAGWHMPTAAEWQNISVLEDLFGTIGAFQSNLKLPASGFRYSSDGGLINLNPEIGYYWSSGALGNSSANGFFFDNLYNAGVISSNRAEGYSCRCVKN